MPRKCISGFAEAGAAMAQQLDDNDLLNLFSAVGRVVSKRFLLKRPSLDRWQLVIDYLTSAMAFAPREQFRVLYLDKRNNLIADEVLAEGTVDHTPVYPREVLRRAIELHATGCVLVHNHPSGDATPSAKYDEMIRAEWASLMDPNHDGSYPGNPDEAQDRIRQAIGTEWSRWELTCHEIELSADT
jgi:DNA repair protein RadC